VALVKAAAFESEPVAAIHWRRPARQSLNAGYITRSID
jgi:hypothetical protein